MNDKERLQLEEELLMTCSKAQAINKYIDELEENSKLSELWCKSQQENVRLKDKIEKLNDYVEDRISVLTVSVDNKAKDEYFNNKCIGGVQELKNVKVILKKN